MFVVSIEFSLSIIVACLPPLSPFFRRYNIITSLLPASIRSRFSSQNRKQAGPWPSRSSGPRSDIEQGTSRQERKTHASWQTPGAWKQAEKHNLDDFHRISQESEITLQPVLPTHRELEHGDWEPSETEDERKMVRKWTWGEMRDAKGKEMYIYLSMTNARCKLALKNRISLIILLSRLVLKPVTYLFGPRYVIVCESLSRGTARKWGSWWGSPSPNFT